MGKEYIFIFQVPWDTVLLDMVKLYMGYLEIAGHLVMTLGQRLCMVAVEFFQDKAIHVSRFLLGRWF